MTTVQATPAAADSSPPGTCRPRPGGG